MKKYLSSLLPTLFVVLMVTVGCNRSSGNRNISRGTGWKINAKDGGFQYNTNYKGQEVGPGLVFIEGGTFTKGKVQDDIMHDWNNTPTQQNVSSFFMDETEVTNVMYLEYLDWLNRIYNREDKTYKAIYVAALPDTLVWRNRLGFNEDMVNNYLRHPAYQEHPVVGVSWHQAVNYAKWRTQRVNELILEQEGYLNRGAKVPDSLSALSTFNTDTYLTQPDKVYGGRMSELAGKRGVSRDSTPQYITRQDGLFLPEYRLPTETEWEYAALALKEVREYNLYRGKKKYPWSGEYTRSRNKRTQGDQLANFKQGKGDYGGIAGWPNDGADITAPVKTFPPNDFGLYDMSGNVAEWVADVYRPIVDDEANDFNYYRGNVYGKKKIDEDGKAVVVDENNLGLEVDTLPNGKINYNRLPGELVTIELDSTDLYLRPNFDRSNNIDYRDGDFGSTRYYNQSEDQAKPMYDAPQNSYDKKDAKDTRSTLIDNKSRVVKGGSWKDRVYWLDPAQRRFLPEYMTSDFVGFRCAMSYLGARPSKRKPRG